MGAQALWVRVVRPCAAGENSYDANGLFGGRGMKRKKTISVTPSSGNVFADLGLPNPEKRLRQAEAKLKAKKSKKPRGKSK